MIHVQNTVVTSLLLVFDYHVKKYINLVLPMPRLFTKNWINYIKLSVSIKLFMSCFIAHEYVCSASMLLWFKSSDYCIVLYSLSRRRREYRTQTGNMKLWSLNNNYILLKSSWTNIKEYIILWIWYFSLLKTYFCYVGSRPAL